MERTLAESPFLVAISDRSFSAFPQPSNHWPSTRRIANRPLSAARFVLGARGVLFYILILCFTTISAPAISDDCLVPRFSYSASTIPMHVGKDSQCIIKMRGGRGDFQLVEVITHAAHGQVGVEQETRPKIGEVSNYTKVVYVPQTGFVGADSFVLHWKGTTGRNGFEYDNTATFNIDVSDYKDESAGFEYLKANGASSGAEVTVSWVMVETEVAPNHQVHRDHYSTTFRLSDHNAIHLIQFQNGNKTRYGDGTIGSSFVMHHINGGDDINLVLNVVGAALVIKDSRDSFESLTTIKTDGRKSCSAERTFRLKPGHQFFESVNNQGVTVMSSDRRVEKIVCSIALRK